MIFPAKFENFSPVLPSVRRIGVGLIAFLYLTALLGCSKEKEDEIIGDDGNGEASTSVVIDSTTISKGTAEGNTGTAANEDDIPANSTFSSAVTIAFGSMVTITNPLSAGGVSIVETNGDVVYS